MEMDEIRAELPALLEDMAELLVFAYSHFDLSDNPEWRAEAERIRLQAIRATGWAKRLREEK